jgi:hypothetical protein
MSNLPQKLPLDQMQTKWASQLNPVLANLLVQGQLLDAQIFEIGSNAVNHKLGRTPNGWFSVSPQGPGQLYEAPYQPNPTLTLTIIASESLISSLWVF